jgi:hypothetical protein
MHELLNTRNSKSISFASELEELTPEQYMFYLDLVLQQMVGQIADPDVIKRKLFAYLTDLRVSWKMKLYPPDVEEAIWSALTDKINLLDSFFDIEEVEGKNVYKMHVKCGVNLLPTWKNYKGPANMLSDITWGQFKICLNALKMIIQAEETRDIKEIEIHTLDIFRALYKLKTRNSKLITIPDTVLFHAQTYFSYVYELITTVPIPINGEDIDFSILWKPDKDEKSNEEDKSGWLGISFSIAESGVFGDYRDVEEENMYNVLVYLYKQKVNARFEREQSKKSE